MNRLKEIRMEMGLNMSEMARRLSMPYTTYVGYEKEERHMYPEALKKISSELGISIDYLLGRSEQKMHTTTKGNGQREEEYEEIKLGFDQLTDQNAEKLKEYLSLLLLQQSAQDGQ